MAGRGIRLFTDEMIGPRISTIPDYGQLVFAYQEQRAILTLNRDDFYDLHAEWQAKGWQHYGIIVSDEMDRASLARVVQQHLDSVDPTDQMNVITELHP
jgi:hypothetical protein